MAKGYNWNKAETEYITTNISQSKLAEKYNIPIRTLQDRARKNEWLKKRNEFRGKTVVKAVQNIEKKEIDRISTILRACDKLVDTINSVCDDPDMFYRVLTEGKSGKINSQKTKVINAKALKEFTGSIRDVLDIYKTAQQNQEDNDNEIVIEVRPVENESGQKSDITNFGEYGK